jgi:hypothetical protein
MDSRRPQQAQQVLRGNTDTRFHYPQASRLPRPAESGNSSQSSNHFPPHPSVRVPANAMPQGRQVPAGVGVAPRPGKPSRPPNNGQMVQNFQFPQVPPPIPTTPANARSRNNTAGNKYNMHDSYVSSIYEDTPAMKSTPSSKSPAVGRGQSIMRDSASVYPETEYSPQPAYPSSRIMPQQPFPLSPVDDEGSAYPSSKTTPYIQTNDLDPPRRIRPGDISPASSRTTAMNACLYPSDAPESCLQDFLTCQDALRC